MTRVVELHIQVDTVDHPDLIRQGTHYVISVDRDTYCHAEDIEEVRATLHEICDAAIDTREEAA